jgi:hypothetical protein
VMASLMKMEINMESVKVVAMACVMIPTNDPN